LKILSTKNISLCEPKDTVTCVRVPKEMKEKREEWDRGLQGKESKIKGKKDFE
jgi:hypothetical protein